MFKCCSTENQFQFSVSYKIVYQWVKTNCCFVTVTSYDDD